MSTTVNRKKSGVLALAIGAIFLALSAPAVHAAPNDGQDTSDQPDFPSSQAPSATMPQLHASENPVVCKTSQVWKAVEVTWTPKAWLHFTVSKDRQPVEEGWFWYKNVAVECGHTFTVQVDYKKGDTWVAGPSITITTVWLDPTVAPQPVPLPVPRPPEINPTLIPRLPGLTIGGIRG